MSINKNDQSRGKLWLNDILIILFQIAKFENNCETRMGDIQFTI